MTDPKDPKDPKAPIPDVPPDPDAVRKAAIEYIASHPEKAAEIMGAQLGYLHAHRIDVSDILIGALRSIGGNNPILDGILQGAIAHRVYEHGAKFAAKIAATARTLDALFDDYFELRATIIDAFGHCEDWRQFVITDERDAHWMIAGGEGDGGLLVWSPDPFTDAILRAGKTIYTARIFTYRHLEQYVFRAHGHVLVLADTQSDGNVFLFALRADRECTDDGLRTLAKECWG